MRTSNPWRWLVWLASLLLLIITGCLWSEFTRIEDAGHLRILYYTIGWVGMFGLVFAFPDLPYKKSLILLFIGAIIVRAAFWSAPVSNDVNRYLWEGRLLWMGESPYATVADDPTWEHLRDRYWEEMNNRDRMTAYPPGMELIMAAASKLWYHPQVFKIVALVGDFWVLGLLVLMAKNFVRPVRWLGFWAFNPLIIASFATEAHFDSMMVAPLLTALWCGHRKSWGWAWFWLGFAVQMKIMALLVAPLLYLRNGWQKSWIFVLVLILPSLVFGEHVWGAVYGLIMFGSQGAFNGGLYECFRGMGFSYLNARLVTVLFFAITAGTIFWRFRKGKDTDLFLAAFSLFQILLICSPVVHFWYLSWIAWYFILSPKPSWLLLFGMVGVYFWAWVTSELGLGWGYERSIVIATWIPFFMLFVWEARWLRGRMATRDAVSSESISLVIPVYQPPQTLGDFLQKLEKASPQATEIIIVDATPAGEQPSLEPSLESSLQASSLAKTRVLPHPQPGRGQQIAAGIAATTGDLIAIIHSDTHPREGWLGEVLRAAREQPRASGFILGQRFDRHSLGLLLIEVMNEARVFGNQVAFGDQTMILRRETLAKVGGFPAQPLMEDVEASYRLREIGPLIYLGREWQVSGAKWTGSFWLRFRLIIGLMTKYPMIRLKDRELAARYSQELFNEYYGHSGG